MKDFENRPGSGFSLIFQDSKNYTEKPSLRDGEVGWGWVSLTATKRTRL